MTDQIVHVIDDDAGIRDGLSFLLETVGQACELYSSALAFLDDFNDEMTGCIVLDIRMPRMTGIDLQAKLNQMNCAMPIIFITGHGDIPMAVKAMRLGALDFIRKPFREQDLLERINEALEYEKGQREKYRTKQTILLKLESLTDREQEVFECVAKGDMNKVIAINLGISERTVEVHRSQVMRKLNVRTLAQLVRLKIETESV